MLKVPNSENKLMDTSGDLTEIKSSAFDIEETVGKTPMDFEHETKSALVPGELQKIPQEVILSN